ncbi:MAG TPA: autotransporter-associated beta strand repeat-containing protein, partial [Chthoniobacterales bacterium]
MICALAGAIPTHADAATVYWDTDGRTAGAGGSMPSGVWDTAIKNWSGDSTGSSNNTSAWTAGDTAVFSAGSDATGAYTVTVSANMNLSVGGITFEDGSVTIAGTNSTSVISLGPIGMTVSAASGTHTINAILDGSGKVLTKQGAGTIVLGGNNNFGQLDMFAGTISVSSDANLGLSTGFTRFWGGTLAATSSFTSAHPFDFQNGNGSFDIVGASTTLTLGGNLYRSLSYTLNKIGAGTLELTQTSFGSGASTIDAGTIRLKNGNALQGTITVNTGTLELANVSVNSSPLILNNGSKLLGTGTATYNTGGYPSIGNAASTTFATASASDVLTVSSYLHAGTSASVVTVNGPGTVVLARGSTATDAYQGSFVLSSGTLRVTDYLALATTGLAQGRPLTVQGGTLDLRADSAVDYRSNVTVTGNATITSQRQTSGAASQQTLGTLSINGSTLTVSNGTSVSSGTQTLTFGSTTLSGNATFEVGNGASAATQLTLGAVSQNLAGRTLTKSGSGTLLLAGAGSYSGATTISGGTLTAAASSGSALGSTNAVTVNPGGTLLLGASDQINNSAGVTLAGGTFATGGFSEGASSQAGVGALTLSATGSHLDFGSGTVGVLSFASFSPGANTLTIDNWTGTANSVGSISTDRLIFN